MNRLLIASIACIILTLSACTYTSNYRGSVVHIEEFPDGSRTMTVTDLGTETKIEVTGKSVRQIRKLIPLPQMDGTESAEPVQYEIHYFYKMELYDTSNVFVNTFVVDTYSDFVDMMPLMVEMGGLPPIDQVDLDQMAADLAVVWVDPQTDWNRFN